MVYLISGIFDFTENFMGCSEWMAALEAILDSAAMKHLSFGRSSSFTGDTGSDIFSKRWLLSLCRGLKVL